MRTASAIAAAVLASATVLAQSPSPTPQFKVAVEYVEIEARVLDEHDQPIQGLARGDFHLLEDGVAQDVTAFAEIDIPPPPSALIATQAGSPALVEILRPDVASNAWKGTDGRVYVMVFDSDFIAAHRIPEVRVVMRRFVERNLGPNDLMAVVTIGRGRAFQNLTNDKVRLIDAINHVEGGKGQSPTIEQATSIETRAAMTPGGGNGGGGSGGGASGDPSPTGWSAGATRDRRVLQLKQIAADLLRVVDWMAGLEARSKSVILVSEGVPVPQVTDLEGLFLEVDLDAVMAGARKSRVPIYTVDPRGLVSPLEELAGVGAVGGLSNATPLAAVQAELDSSRAGLRRLSEETGGFATLATNDFTGAFDRIVRQASSYYVLGYYPKNTRRDGRVRAVHVKVGRAGATVIASSGYTAPLDQTRARPAAPPDRLRDAMNSRLPATGLALATTAAFFRERNSTASVAIVTETSGENLAGPIELAAIAIDRKGNVKAGDTKDLRVTLAPLTLERVRQYGFRWLSRIDLKPGSYQIRVAVSGASKQGSVWYDVDVPDLSDGDMAMSGLLVSSAAAFATPTLKPDPQLAGILPGPPTASREFPAGDELAVFAEVYDNRPSDRRDVDVSVRVRTENGREVFRQDNTVTREQVQTRRGVIRSVTRFPLHVLPGNYVLTVEAQRSGSPSEPVRRAIPFRVH